MNKIYFDNAATTKMKEEVVDVMVDYMKNYYANPSSVYSIAGDSKYKIDTAREMVADAIGASDKEIYFTSGGSESDNWAIKGIAESYKHKGNHIITSKIEHHAVLHTCEYLEKNGYEVTYLDVDEDGMIDLEDLKKAIKDTTILISIMYANNEIGTIQPISEIGKIARENKILFHTDAVQAVGQVDIDIVSENIDLLSMSAHKLGGPKGVGALYIRKGIRIENLIHGGAQERGKRAGTENVAGIIGFAKAVEISLSEMKQTNAKIIKLRDKLVKGIEDNINHSKLNGHRTKRLPNNVNFSFEFIEGESLLLFLDMQGICASSGSACTSGSLDPSHVLLAIGLPHEKAHGSLRITLGKNNTEEEVDKLLEILPGIVQRLRDMSPLSADDR